MLGKSIITGVREIRKFLVAKNCEQSDEAEINCIPEHGLEAECIGDVNGVLSLVNVCIITAYNEEHHEREANAQQDVGDNNGLEMRASSVITGIVDATVSLRAGSL